MKKDIPYGIYLYHPHQYGCLCCSLRYLVLTVGFLSSMCCLVLMMTSVVVLSNSYPWLLVMQQTSTFLQSIHWDVTVSIVELCSA